MQRYSKYEAYMYQNVILDQRPGSDPLGGLTGWGRGENLTLSEYYHVAYQIRGMTPAATW